MEFKGPCLWPVSHSWSFTVTRHTTDRVLHAERVSYGFRTNSKKSLINLVMSPSVCPYVSPRLPLYGFSSYYVFETFAKIRLNSPDLVKLWQKYRGICTNINYVYIVDSSTKYFAARRQCQGRPLLSFHGNTYSFYIVDNYMYVGSRKGMHVASCSETRGIWWSVRV